MNLRIYIPFIKKSFLFIIGFFVLVFLLQFTINQIIKYINIGEYGVLNKINEGKINADIIVSGSSRALKAVNPEIITRETGMSCFNIASDGSDLGIQLPKLKWYINNNRKPKIIIQDVSQFGGGISSTIYEPFKYLPYISDDSLYAGILRIDKDFWIHKFFAPANLLYYNFDFYAKFAQELVNTINKKENFKNGFLPDNSKWTGNFDLYKKENPNGINCSVNDDYVHYLKGLMQLCRYEDIILFFVVLPNYYRLKEITVNLNDVLTYYKSLKDEHNVYFFDYSETDISKNEEYFYNLTHLNLLGADTFSKNICKDLNKIIASKR
ncbi:MAG: hypothetical protein WAR79_06655 [Melioribacteraceae bacterium]